MNVKRSELLKALKQCLPGIENGNSVLEGADLFVFSKGFVCSYNDVISVSVPVKSEGLLEESVEGAVRAEEFYGIINKFNGDLIEFTVEKEKWILKSGKAKAELVLMSGDFTERFESIAPSGKKWLEISSEFTQGLGICKMSNNKNDVSGLFITSKDITSTDGLQINHFNYKGADFDNFWISDESVSELLKVGVLTHIQLKGSWAHFQTDDNTTFSVKTLQAEKYPYEKIIEAINKHKKTKDSVSATFPKELFDAIDRASNFYMDISDSRAVRLVINPKRILVTAERPSGKYEEKVSWDKECPPFDEFVLFVDTQMILFAARRSMSFYTHTEEGKAPRICFVTDNSIHLMATLTMDDEEKAETKKETAKTEKKKNDNKEDEDDTPPWRETKNNKTEKKAEKLTKENAASIDKKGRLSVNPPDEDEEDEEEDDEPPVKKKSKKKPIEEDDEEDDSDDEDIEDDEEDPDMGDEDLGNDDD